MKTAALVAIHPCETGNGCHTLTIRLDATPIDTAPLTIQIHLTMQVAMEVGTWLRAIGAPVRRHRRLRDRTVVWDYPTRPNRIDDDENQYRERVEIAPRRIS